MSRKSAAATGTGEKFSSQIVKHALLGEADEGFPNNFLASPLSISFFLNLFAAGTKGPILDQLLNRLDAKSLNELHERSKKLSDISTAKSSKSRNYLGQPIVSTANGVFVNQICTVKDSFLEILNSVYQIHPKPLDFTNKSEESAKKVNDWVSKKTKGLIQQICDPNLISDKLMIIVNTIYFKAGWYDQFKPRCTQEKPFHLLNGEKIDVPFMWKGEADLPYGSFPGFKILQLPYQSGGYKNVKHFSMYFFLPDEIGGIGKLIERFNSDPEFLNQNFKLKTECIRRLEIPKFKFEYEFSVSDMMRGLGYNFPEVRETEMIHPMKDGEFEGQEEFVVLQRAIIEVDEKGTEAAAAIRDYICGCDPNYEPPPAVIDFIADHPFLFMIREDSSKVPFFFGAVMNPKDEGN